MSRLGHRILFILFLGCALDLGAKPLVVIDPGHGGKAGGAEGYYGVYEKEVTLKIALYIRELLNEHGIDVVLTRDLDVNLPLKERSEIANRLNACCFVSIHCNASVNLEPHGVETWVVGHGVNPFEIDPTQPVPEELVSVRLLSDLQAQGLLLRSLHLAYAIHTSMMGYLKGVKDRGIKRAGYAVLHYSRRPAVVVETGFITNPKEGSLLITPEYQKKVAMAVAEGIMRFIKEGWENELDFIFSKVRGSAVPASHLPQRSPTQSQRPRPSKGP